LLLAQRAPATSYAWNWCTPGGKVGEETHHDALARELHEELGIVLLGQLGRLVYRCDVSSSRTGELMRVHCYLIQLGDIPSAVKAQCLDKTIGVGWFGRHDILNATLALADGLNRKTLMDLVS
jgi:8-oxo-dGTP pyrophosphatase MutT (NUDIX family)